MYAAVQARTAEIGTLRALGFSRGSILLRVPGRVAAARGARLRGRRRARGAARGALISSALGGIGVRRGDLHHQRDRRCASGAVDLAGGARCSRSSIGARRRARAGAGAPRGCARSKRCGRPERMAAEQRERRRDELAALRIDRERGRRRDERAALARCASWRARVVLLLARSRFFGWRATLRPRAEVQRRVRASAPRRAASAAGAGAHGLGLRRHRRPLHLDRRARAGPHRALPRRGGRARREGPAARAARRARLRGGARRRRAPALASARARTSRCAARSSSARRSCARSDVALAGRARREAEPAATSSRAQVAAARGAQSPRREVEPRLHRAARADATASILAKLKEVGEIAVPGGFAGSGDLIRMANLDDLRAEVDVNEIRPRASVQLGPARRGRARRLSRSHATRRRS